MKPNQSKIARLQKSQQRARKAQAAAQQAQVSTERTHRSQDAVLRDIETGHHFVERKDHLTKEHKGGNYKDEGHNHKGKGDCHLEREVVSDKSTDLYIKNLSRQLSNLKYPKEGALGEEHEERTLRQACEDTGEALREIGAVEVWVFDEQRGCLTRPRGGWWRDPELNPGLNDKIEGAFSAPDPSMPGVNLAGELWTSSRSPVVHRKTGFHRKASAESLDNARSQPYFLWRDLSSLLNNPDTPMRSRVLTFQEAGFQHVAGVPFDITGTKGLVIYFAHDLTRIMETVTIKTFIVRSTNLIGSVLAATEAKRACFALLIQNDDRDATKNEKVIEKHVSCRTSSMERNLLEMSRRVKIWFRKSLGGKMQPPPAMGWAESVFTLFGCMTSLAILQSAVVLLPFIDDGGFHLMGPIGSLVALHYGLSSSPTSQPRNVILGQAVAGAIAMAFAYIPWRFFGVWGHVVVGPALAITVMVKLGVTHPPAGATAVILASQPPDWDLFGCVLLVSTLTIFPAIFINNISPRRQYPTYWAVVPWHNRTKG